MPLEPRLERRRSFDEMCRQHEAGGVSVHYLTPAENFIGSWTTRSRRRLMLRFEYIWLETPAAALRISLARRSSRFSFSSPRELDPQPPK